MQTTITWKELVNGGNQIIKLDDRRGSFPAEGEEVTLNGRRYEVVGMEEAVVLLTALEPPPADPANPARKDGKVIESKGVVAAREAAADDTDSPLAKRNERVERRLSEEKAPPAKDAAKHADERTSERAESTVTRNVPRAAPHQATTHHHVTSHKKK